MRLIRVATARPCHPTALGQIHPRDGVQACSSTCPAKGFHNQRWLLQWIQRCRVPEGAYFWAGCLDFRVDLWPAEVTSHIGRRLDDNTSYITAIGSAYCVGFICFLVLAVFLGVLWNNPVRKTSKGSTAAQKLSERGRMRRNHTLPSLFLT